MNNEDWEKAKKIFAAVRKLATEQRAQYLDEAYGDDAGTRREVESLLAFYDDADSFMQTPAVGEVADVIHRTKNPEKGKCFGHYEIIEKIGAGGMGEVYLALDKKLDRRVAVKILNEKFARHESNLARFVREAKTASALNHPNILVIHEIVESDAAYYIVSEFIKGKTLREVFNEKILNLSEALDIAVQIAGSLSAAHEAHLVHRDIKPENIMIRPDGLVKILDFGLAKLTAPELQDFGGENPQQTAPEETAPGVIMGTVNYMSPEQARGRPIDSRTDIFSFGIVFYEMLTRQQPFKGETTNHTIVAILEKQPPSLAELGIHYPAEVENIIEKCLAKSADQRYQSAADLLKDLRTLQKRLEFEAELKRSSVAHQKPAAATEGFNVEINPETVQIPSPTLPSVSPLPNNLSENPEPIIGREKEIAEIKDLLQQTGVRLVTLTGVGGTGKTRLAQAAARTLLPDFPDGVFFIELAAITGAELVASAIAQPLGIKEAGGKPILEILKDYLSNKKMLLVIDNFEQVTDAAPQIGELLHASRVKILITSRTLLRLSAEREFVVPPLAAPAKDSEVSLAEVAGYDAVKLFVQRARKAKPEFVLTEENARSVAEICSRLDGLPLAIELAAARVKILAPQAILIKLENRLRFLTGGARDLPARQQTIRGAVEWSYELLSKAEKGLFHRLSVFAGGFTFEAAETVCAGFELHKEQIDFLDLITSLVEKSLLVMKVQSDGGTRFRMLEVVREYALELLEASDEAETIVRRHAEYFLALGEEAEPHLQGERGIRWLDRLEDEHENLRAALSWSLENDPETAVRLAGALRLFWNFHGHLTEGRQWLEKVLECKCEMTLDTRWKILHGVGLIAIPQGDYHSARKFLEQSKDAADLAGDRQRTALSANALALALCELDDRATAKALTEESLAIGRELNDKKVIAQTLYCLGDLTRSEGDYRTARRFLEESLDFFKQIDINNGICACCMILGAVTCTEGDYEMSRFYYKKAVEIGRKLGHKGLLSYCLDGFAALAAKHNEFERSVRLSGAAAALRESIGFIMENEERRFRDAYLTELTTKMDEADFSELYEQGRRLKLEEAISVATGLNTGDEQTAAI